MEDSTRTNRCTGLFKSLIERKVIAHVSNFQTIIKRVKSSLFSKIGVKSTNELILFAFRVGLVS